MPDLVGSLMPAGEIADEPRENRATAMVHASNEQPAPTAILSSAKRTALIACLKGGGTLHQRYGVWGSEVVGVRSRCCRAFNLKEGERKRLLVREAGLDGDE
jgi:hypothetical protein